MVKWEELELEKKIIEVLSMPEFENKPYLMKSYLTPYQIAIELTRKYPGIAKKMGMKIGGKGIGVHTSLAQYISRMLSTKIKNKEIQNIERAFISMKDITDMIFRNAANNKTIHPSKANHNTISMYRMKKS